MFKKLNHAFAIVLSLTIIISLFAGFPPKAQAEEAAAYGELPAPPILMPAAVNPDYSQMEKPIVEAHSNGDGTGYLDVSWNPVEGAEKYQVILFNGNRHSYWDVAATETSWTTQGKGMFPTPSQIEAGQVDFLRTGTGGEFALNPNDLYTKAYELNGGLDYRNSVDYYIRVTTVYDDGASPISYPTKVKIPLATPQVFHQFLNAETDSTSLHLEWDRVLGATAYRVTIISNEQKLIDDLNVGESINFTSPYFSKDHAVEYSVTAVDGFNRESTFVYDSPVRFPTDYTEEVDEVEVDFDQSFLEELDTEWETIFTQEHEFIEHELLEDEGDGTETVVSAYTIPEIPISVDTNYPVFVNFDWIDGEVTPYWVGIARVGVTLVIQASKLVIKNSSKKVVKTYTKVSPHVVNSALNGYRTVNFKFGDKTYKLTKDTMKHILERHHPKYWNGSTKSTQTFLNDRLSIKDVENIIRQTANQNYNLLKNSKHRVITVEGRVNGIKYHLKFDNGKVVQFYPKQ